MSSMSEPREMTGLPEPQVATHAVGIPVGLLESQLAKAEDLIYHLLGKLRATGNVLHGFLLERGESGRLRCSLQNEE